MQETGRAVPEGLAIFRQILSQEAQLKVGNLGACLQGLEVWNESLNRREKPEAAGSDVPANSLSPEHYALALVYGAQPAGKQWA
jgi:hypothetical protein